jgi:hypothetical protein
MNNNEFNRMADLIIDKLFLIENESKSRGELIELIKPILLELYSNSINIGRNQILNYFNSEISRLKESN